MPAAYFAFLQKFDADPRPPQKYPAGKAANRVEIAGFD